MTVLLVVVGGALGAVLRFVVDSAVGIRWRGRLPLGTLVVNTAGSLVLGATAAGVSAGAPGAVAAVVGTGFCGAFTTWSTFGFETVRLAEEGDWRTAAGTVAAHLVAGLAAVVLGWTLVSALR